MFQDRLKKIIELSLESLFNKIHHRMIVVENEASLQLQLSSILKSLGDLFIYSRDEKFSIELEKPVVLNDGKFNKSNSSKAKIDIFMVLENQDKAIKSACAIELKYFKKNNHREPNNRYDVFKDLNNLEQYDFFCDFGVLLVVTDHEHYISKKNYSEDTKDFDFRDGSNYQSGSVLKYRTNKPYGEPIVLDGDYQFNWEKFGANLNYLKVYINHN